MNDFIIGERVKKLREARGISQKVFAKILGVSPSRLSNWENGYNKIPLEFIPVVAAELGGSVDALLGINFAGEGCDDLICLYMTLNAEGRAALMRIAEDFTQIPKYTEKEKING